MGELPPNVYIVTPAFVFETGAVGSVVYNEALVVDHDRDDLAVMEWLSSVDVWQKSFDLSPHRHRVLNARL